MRLSTYLQNFNVTFCGNEQHWLFSLSTQVKFPRPQTDFSPLHFTLNFCAQPGARGGFISAKTLFSLNAGYPYHFAFKQYSFPDIYLVASCQLA